MYFSFLKYIYRDCTIVMRYLKFHVYNVNEETKICNRNEETKLKVETRN
jgi:hypothetical protein